MLRRRLTYANVTATLSLFLVLSGGAAIAANQLTKNSVGSKQLRKNAVTAVKIKNGAVTATKISDGAVTGKAVADGSLVGADINVGTLGTVPNAAKTDVLKGAQGKLAKGQEVTIFQHGPLAISVKCAEFEVAPQKFLDATAYISSASDGSVFSSDEDEGNQLGPATPAAQREVAEAISLAGFSSEGSWPVSATAAGGQSFNATVNVAADKSAGVCTYWVTGQIIS